MEKLKIGVLLSGNGSNLQAILDDIAYHDLPVQVTMVAASRPDAYGLVRAQHADIPTLALNKQHYLNPEAADALIVKACKQAGVIYVVMAGYMRRVTPIILKAFPDRVLNIHPALLPSFKGAHAIYDAFAAGVKITGVTVHFANEDYDKGPIVAQQAVKVFPTDTLEALEERIHQVEHQLYPAVLRHLAQGHISIGLDRKVSVHE